jgi:hypothetical protein
MELIQKQGGILQKCRLNVNKHTYVREQENMNKDKIANEENSEIINKLYSNSNIPEKHSSKIEHGTVTKLNDNGDSEKYIKEMHDLADKNEFKNNVVVLGLGVVIVSVIIFSILMNTSFMKPKTDIAKSGVAVNNTMDNSSVGGSSSNPVETIADVSDQAPDKIYKYLDIEANRTSVLASAVNLNNGSQKGVTVYLLSEILRSNNFTISADTSNVEQLMKDLISLDWKKNSDFTQLEKGDICFTTDMPEKPGVPSHTYVFMGWVEDGKTDYAYVCDGQVEEYGSILHKRNISISTAQKDKFSFFLRK